MSRTRRLVSVLVVLLGLLVVDLVRPPERQASARILIGAIHLYQRTLSPWASLVGARCRFEPSCSRYAEASLSRLGTLRGLALTAARLARCGPWTAEGTLDPPPGGAPGAPSVSLQWNSVPGSTMMPTP